MSSQIDALFPVKSEVRSFPLLLIHRPNPFSKSYTEDVVYMTLQQFEIFKEKNKDLEYLTMKKRKERMNNPFGTIVSMKFSSLLTHKIIIADV